MRSIGRGCRLGLDHWRVLCILILACLAELSLPASPDVLGSVARVSVLLMVLDCRVGAFSHSCVKSWLVRSLRGRFLFWLSVVGFCCGLCGFRMLRVGSSAIEHLWGITGKTLDPPCKLFRGCINSVTEPVADVKIKSRYLGMRCPFASRQQLGYFSFDADGIWLHAFEAKVINADTVCPMLMIVCLLPK